MSGNATFPGRQPGMVKAASPSGTNRQKPPGRRLGALLCLIMLLILAGRSAQAQNEVQASASLRADATRLLVGDQARVFLSAQCDPNVSRISWPQVPDSFGKLEVVEKGKIDTVKQGALDIYTQRLLVSGWDSADYVIPPFQLEVTPKNGAPYTIQTEALTLQVSTVPVDTTKPFKPIKGIMQVESSWWADYWWIFIPILILGIVGFILWKETRKKPVLKTPPAPEVPLHERTLALLAALDQEQVWQRGNVKEYYVRLTDILRGYIEARFRVAAMERTTDELMAVAQQHPELAFQAEKLYSILATADMAKFARAQPTPTEHLSSMQTAKEIVIATIPKPEPEVTTQTPNSSEPRP